MGAIASLFLGVALAGVSQAQRDKIKEPPPREPKTSIAQKMVMLKQDVLKMDVCLLNSGADRNDVASAAVSYAASAQETAVTGARDARKITKNSGVWAWKLDVCADNAEDAYQKALSIISTANSPAAIRIIANKIIRSQDCLERLPERGIAKRTNYFVEIIASCNMPVAGVSPAPPASTRVAPAPTTTAVPEEKKSETQELKVSTPEVRR